MKICIWKLSEKVVLFVWSVLSHHHKRHLRCVPININFCLSFSSSVCVLPALDSIIRVHYNQLFFIVGKNWDMHVSSVISTHNKLLWINTCKLIWSSHKRGSFSLSFLSSFITWNHFSYHLELVVSGWKNKEIKT